MKEDLLTATQMFTALVGHYGYLITAFDKKRQERRATDRVKRGLVPRYCAACSTAENAIFRLEAAHIAPLSECETTSLENLLWLCRARTERHISTEIGCHTMFDDGCCSIADMRECRRQWATGSRVNYRGRMIALRSKFGAMQLQQGSLKKELHRRIAHRNAVSSSGEWHERQVDVVEAYRRLARRGALDQARQNWQRMDISSGWDRGFRATLLLLYGRLRLQLAEDDRTIDAALAYLVRSLVIFRMRRHQPEGMRDLLFSIADALQRKGDRMHGEIRSIASRCSDASSWFNPSTPS